MHYKQAIIKLRFGRKFHVAIKFLIGLGIVIYVFSHPFYVKIWFIQHEAAAMQVILWCSRGVAT
jgi:hypothetical protein